MNTCRQPHNVAKLWQVVYRYLRSRGQSHLDAQDSAQEVFHQLMRRQRLGSFLEETASPSHLNNRLCLAAKRLLVDQYRRENAQKRGSARMKSEEDLEAIPSQWPAPDESLAEKETRHHIESSLAQLGQEMEARGQGSTFDALKPFFQEHEVPPSHASVAKRLSQNEANVRVIASRMRRRLRVLALEAAS